MVKVHTVVSLSVLLSSVSLFWIFSSPSLTSLGTKDTVSYSDITNDIFSYSDGVESKHKELSIARRVVLLVGPHKTSSTSEQANIVRWINTGILKKWSWPAPEIIDNGSCGVGRVRDRGKVFYAYFDTLNERGDAHCLRKLYADRGLSKHSLTYDFEQGFRDAWREGNNLIIASEAMDFVSVENRRRGDRLMRRILHAMPWNTPSAVNVKGSNDDITVVVNFRSPRVKHLISLWHECCMNKISFQTYLTTFLPTNIDKLRALDSFNLVEVFLNQGLEVVLIDMAGVSRKGYDISNVVACDVLGADCTSNKSIVGDTVLPIVLNVKTRHYNVTNHLLGMIETKIRNYDCKFQNITDHARLTILYPDELMRMFNDCKSISLSDRILTRGDLIESLREIAQYN